MSQYHGNHQTCPHCGITYRRFTTGLTYFQVFELLKDYSTDSADWTYKRRHTVLGKWHQIKREQWDRHIDQDCSAHPLNVEASKHENEIEVVPF